MIVYRCKHRGCNSIALKGSNYCAEHKKDNVNFSSMTHTEHLLAYKKYNKQSRDTEANAFYHSSAWTKVRTYVANRDMYTSGVTGKVITDKDLIVDHVVPRKLSKDKLDTSNLWCLSRKEHLIKTRIEESLTDNQLKHVSRKWWIKVIKEKL